MAMETCPKCKGTDVMKKTHNMLSRRRTAFGSAVYDAFICKKCRFTEFYLNEAEDADA